MNDLVDGCLCGKIRYASKAAPVMTAGQSLSAATLTRRA